MIDFVIVIKRCHPYCILNSCVTLKNPEAGRANIYWMHIKLIFTSEKWNCEIHSVFYFSGNPVPLKGHCVRHRLRLSGLPGKDEFGWAIIFDNFKENSQIVRRALLIQSQKFFTHPAKSFMQLCHWLNQIQNTCTELCEAELSRNLDSSDRFKLATHPSQTETF